MRAERMQELGRAAILAISLAATAAAQDPPRRPPSRLPPNFPGRSNPNAPPGVNTPGDPLAGPPRPTAAPAVDLSGPWKGMFCWDISVEFADLTLTASPDHRDLTGELKFTPLPSPALRNVRPVPETTWSIRGRIDPGSNAVWLTPPPAPPRTTIAPIFEQQPLAAVFAAGRNEIAGQFRSPFTPTTPDPGATYFLFVRAGNAKDGADAVARLKSLAEHAASAAPPAKGSGNGSPPSDGDLVKWAAPYENEYGGSAGTGGVEQISQRAMPLLSDATFKPVFGETYDRIDFGTLASAMRRFAGVDAKFAQQHGFMQYALRPSPTKIVSIAAMRTIEAWEDEMLARFLSGPPVASAFDDLAATQKAIGESVVFAWPSTKKRLDGVIEQLRSTLSGSSLGANVDGTIASAADLEGAKTLASWSKDNAAMLQRLSPSERDAAQKRVDAKLDELLQPLLEPLVAQLARLGTGEEAVRAGATWYQSLLAQFAFASARPPFAQALAKLTSRRDPDLTAGSERILQRFQAFKTPEEVDAVFANDLSVPGDDATKAYAALADAGRKRKQKIEDDRILALFSREEQEIMDRPGHLDLSRAKNVPPSPEEMRLAMVRGWAFGTGKMLDAHTARHVDRLQSGFGLPFSVNVQFANERKISADRIGETKDYECQFQVVMQMSLPDDNILANYDAVTRAGTENMLKLVNSFCVAASSEAQKKTLRLTENGWVIPELMEAGAIEGAFGEMLKGR